MCTYEIVSTPQDNSVPAPLLKRILQRVLYFFYYVSFEQSQPDIKWVENAKTLFKVRTHVASTIYAQVRLDSPLVLHTLADMHA